MDYSKWKVRLLYGDDMQADPDYKRRLAEFMAQVNPKPTEEVLEKYRQEILERRKKEIRQAREARERAELEAFERRNNPLGTQV